MVGRAGELRAIRSLPEFFELMFDRRESVFSSDGALLLKGALQPCMEALEAAVENLPTDEAGLRIHGIPALNQIIAATGCIGMAARSILGKATRPVRAILFNKSATTNWALGWHQDRTICVKARHNVPGFGPWTIKRGMHHVAPPVELLTRMVTARAHLDDVPETNAPLIIAPGSHVLGRIAVGDVAATVSACGARPCLAVAGDLWLYSTPILHASKVASAPNSRRVLQVDYAAEDMPGGLEWLGV